MTEQKKYNGTYVFVLSDGTWQAGKGKDQTDAWHNMCQTLGWNPTAASSCVLAAFKNSPNSKMYHPEFDE